MVRRFSCFISLCLHMKWCASKSCQKTKGSYTLTGVSHVSCIYLNHIFWLFHFAASRERNQCLSNACMISPLCNGDHVLNLLNFGAVPHSLSSFNITTKIPGLDPGVWGLILSLSCVCCWTEPKQGMEDAQWDVVLITEAGMGWVGFKRLGDCPLLW